MRSDPLEAQRRRGGVLLAGVTALISGVSVFVNGYGVRAWAEISDATTYTTLKNAVAALVLIVVAAVAAARRVPGEGGDAASRRHLAGLAGVAVVGGGVPFVLFFEGLSRSTSSDAAFIHKTLVVWVAILAVAFLRERIGVAHVAALALLVLGQAALSGGVGSLSPGGGELMILAATLLWAVETVIAKRLLGSVAPLTVGLARMGGGALLLMGYSLARGGFADLAGVTAEHVGWILITGLTLSGYVATWFAALARAPAVDVTAILVAGALVTAMLELGVTRVPIPSVAGAALVAAGVLVVAWRGGLRPAPAP